MFASNLGADAAVYPGTLPYYLPGQIIQPATSASGVDKLIPGASVLPASVGGKLTIKNMLIGGALAVTAYLTYAVFFAPPPKKGATAPTTAASTVAGLFGVRRRRRRRH